MLEAGIEMCLFLEADNLLKMRVVNVGINTEQPLEYGLHDIFKVWRERCSYEKTADHKTQQL